MLGVAAGVAEEDVGTAGTVAAGAVDVEVVVCGGMLDVTGRVVTTIGTGGVGEVAVLAVGFEAGVMEVEACCSVGFKGSGVV